MGCRHDKSRLAWLVTLLVTASTVGTASAVVTSAVVTAGTAITEGTASKAEVRSSGAGPVRVVVEIIHRFGVAPESSAHSPPSLPHPLPSLLYNFLSFSHSHFSLPPSLPPTSPPYFLFLCSLFLTFTLTHSLTISESFSATHRSSPVPL